MSCNPVDTEIPIIVENLSKVYRLYNSPAGRLKEALWRGRRSYHREFWALKDLSFSVFKGETVGVIGRNGSGKSTLLQLIAGIIPPTYGTIRVNGKVSALLELGSGFDPEYTGRENVFMNGAILGFSHEEMAARFDDIAEFAEIGEFMDHPVKLYSSGMFVRLAFATAINVDPDILLVDEALAVGDTVFQHRCMSRIRKIQEQDKTIFFVSHDIGAVQKLCSKAILLEEGEMVCMGTPEEVTQEYHRIVWHVEDHQPAESLKKDSADTSPQRSGDARMIPVDHYDHRYGSRKGEIIAYSLGDVAGNFRNAFHGGSTLCVCIAVRCHDDIDMPLVGLVIKDLLGNELIKTNTDAEQFILKPCEKGGVVKISFSILLPHLRPGSYAVSIGFGTGTVENHTAYDWIENIAVFTMESNETCHGLLKAPIEVDQMFLTESDVC